MRSLERSTREMARKALAARGPDAGSLRSAVRAAERDFAKLDRQLRKVASPDALLAYSLAHVRIWNKHAPGLGLPLHVDPDAPEEDL